VDKANKLTATEAAAAIRAGRLSSESLVRACLERIAAREADVAAWTYLDEARALAQAKTLDEALASGEAPGPLHGIPVGVKDIYDTADMPTQLGSPLHQGRQPNRDSGVVELLGRAGAVILGKTVTTEFALSHPGKTRNPRDPNRTPGGSSSGSAAAVADFMVPLAIGSQTVGSMIRPGSFCGVFAYKPTFGSVSRRGMKLLCRRLDHVGVYARSVEDLALIGDAVMVNDPEDDDMLAHPGRDLISGLAQLESWSPQRLAFVRSPLWDQADGDAQRAYEDYCRKLGNVIGGLNLPPEFDHALEDHHIVLNAHLAAVFKREYEETPEQLSGKLKARIENGIGLAASELVDATHRADQRRRALDRLIAGYDAVLTPAAPGEAPADLGTTGNAAFNAIWTQCGVPAVSVPLLQGAHGMPLGVQVVAPRGRDVQALAVSRWLWRRNRNDA
jgi:Asp-tRNA(Asn)/Glu-tRNA(Gln) amidotransferase A subunit family amidase